LPSLVRTTVAAALAYSESLIGISRQSPGCPWTPFPTVDDCSYFQSHVLFGGKPGPIGWCDNWKEVATNLGTYHRGATGIEPGDVLLFDWDGNGVANHVGQATSVLSGGVVRTREANTSAGIAVRNTSRAKKWILGYFRPAWATAHLAHPASSVSTGKSSAVIAQHIIRSENDMYVIKNTSTGDEFTVGMRYVHHHASSADAVLASKVFSDQDEIHAISNAQVESLFATLGIPTRYANAETLVKEHSDHTWDALRITADKIGANLA
jgi:hypothetical protein